MKSVPSKTAKKHVTDKSGSKPVPEKNAKKPRPGKSAIKPPAEKTATKPVPSKTKSSNSIPNKSIPNNSTLNKSTPGSTTPRSTAPGKTVPGKSAPGKKVPSKIESPVDEKLHKVLARAGMGSRREMERWIAEGRVRINDRVAHLGDRVKEGDRVIVDGHIVNLRSKEETPRRVLIYNKPEGEICSRKDPEGRPTVFDALPPLLQGRWIAIGRLDYNTTGLLLFTNDGDLANSMMHPSTQIDREYLVRVLGEVDDDMIKRLKKGVMLDDGMARFSDMTAGGGEGANKFFYVVIMEGRNREVRRLWESQGITVSRLKRVRYGNVFLPSRIKRGNWMEMPKPEVDALCTMVGLKPQSDDVLKPQQKEKQQRQERRQQRIRSRGKSDAPYAPEPAHKPKAGTKARTAARKRATNADIDRFSKPEKTKPSRK